MHKPISTDSGIPNHHVFAKFGLMKVNLEVSEEFVGRQWQPLELERLVDVTETYYRP